MKKKNIFLVTEEDLLIELGENQNIPEPPPDRKSTALERQLAAEVAVFLEYDLGVDLKRLFIQVREGHLYIQGSVESIDLKDEIEKSFKVRPNIKSCELNLSVQKSL